jgi:ribose transport system permease protein
MTTPARNQLAVNLGDATIYLTVIALFIVNVILQPRFAQVSNLLYLLGTTLPLVFAAVAQGLVMLTSSIDLASGSIISLTNVTIEVLVGHGSATAIVVAIVAGTILGALAGLLTAVLRLPSIIVTLALSSVWAGIALYVLPQPQSGVPDWFSDLTNGYVPLYFTLALVALWLWLARTRFGRRIYAVGSSENAAYTAGIPVVATRVAVFAISGALLALAALMLSSTTGGGDPLSGSSITLEAIAAAVLGGISFQGGKGSLIGAIFGALALTLITNLVFNTGASAFYQDVVYGILLVLALAMSRFTSRRWIRMPVPVVGRGL